MNCSHLNFFSTPLINRFLAIVIIVSFLATLISCGASKQSATLDSLEDKEITFAEIEPSSKKMSRKKVITTYENVITGKTASNEKIYQDSLRRLADLKLESGVNKNNSRSERLQSQSKVDIVSAIRQYKSYLKKYPDKESNNEIYYQLSKAYELLGELENSLATLNTLIEKYPNEPRWQEINFRRGETMFVLGDYKNSEKAYKTIVDFGSSSIYYQRSLYKYSWSLFKQNKHEQTLVAFFKLLDEKFNVNRDSSVPGIKPDKSGTQKATSKTSNQLNTLSDQELVKDTMRALSLTFTYLDGPKSVSSYLKENGPREYEPQIYKSLAALYTEKNRTIDSANTYLEFITHHPQHDHAPEFHSAAIRAYSDGGFASLILPTKETFVENYGVNTVYWNSHSIETQELLKPQLQKHITDLSSHYHSLAKKNRKRSDYNKAAKWYAEYIKSFPKDKKASKNNFLLAELLFDSKQYTKAITEYEKTAYNYPNHRKSSTAAYAALLSFEKLIPTLKKDKVSLWQQKSIESALRFSVSFPKSKQVNSVLIKTTEKLFTLKDYTRAASTAEQLLNRPGNKSRKELKSAWTILAHAKFELGSYKVGNYKSAEIAYRKSIKYYDKKDKKRSAIIKRLAESIYKQGEELRVAGNHEQAAKQFLRVRRSVPKSKIVATAEYDAAAEYITLGLWKNAGKILERFRKTQPRKHRLQSGVTEKLALVYSKSGQHVKAAGELEILALNTKDKAESQRILWQVALIYKTANLPKRQIKAYTQHIKLFPSKPESMEARSELVKIYKKSNNRKQQWYWLNNIIKADKKYPATRTEESKTIVAEALLTMAEPKHVAYNKVKLTIPLKKSLRKKKSLMKKAISAYTVAINYQVASVTTSATYRIAEIYRDFATSLMKSQRPKKLNEEQLEEYELLLEEQAFPLEEKAIEIHATILSRIKDGIYNKWVKSSLKQLSILQPARYAKPEQIEQYSNAVH